MSEILFVDCLHMNVLLFVSVSDQCTRARLHVSVLTHWRLVVAEHSAGVVVFEQRAQHLGTHLGLPPQRHVGRDHFVVRVHVVTGGGDRKETFRHWGKIISRQMSSQFFK